MKWIIIYLIRAYQIFPTFSHKCCRFTPTCSEYMILAIKKHGTIKGIKMGIKRILKCRPGGTCGIDNVPNKEEF